MESLDFPQSFKIGYGLGQATWGALEMFVGGGGHMLGLALDATGFGAAAGIPVQALSTAVGIEGAADLVAGYGVLRSAVLNKNAGGANGTNVTNKLSKPLRNKMKHIKNQTAAGGNRGVSGSVSESDAIRLGEEFVGPNYRPMSGGKGLVSEDGLRTFRFPSKKTGINPITGEPWSKTGRVVNFETKLMRGETPISNVHLDVE